MVIVKSFVQILKVLDCVDKITADDKVYLCFFCFYFLHQSIWLDSSEPPSSLLIEAGSPAGAVDTSPVRRNYRLIFVHLSSTKPIYFLDRTALSPMTRTFQEVGITTIDKQLRLAWKLRAKGTYSY